MGYQVRSWMRACAVTAIFVVTGSANAQQQEGFSATDKLAPEFQLTPFYEANLDFAGKKPGDVIKREAIPAPAGAVAWRVMYVSRTSLPGSTARPERPG